MVHLPGGGGAGSAASRSGIRLSVAEIIGSTGSANSKNTLAKSTQNLAPFENTFFL